MTENTQSETDETAEAETETDKQQAEQQATETAEQYVEIGTYGRIARSVMTLLGALSTGVYDGVRMQVTDSELRAEWCDPARVGMGNVRVDLDAALDSFASVRSNGSGSTDFMAGIKPQQLSSKLRFARKTTGDGLGDSVTIRFEDGEGSNGGQLRGKTGITIRRCDGAVPLTRETAMKNLDPASVVDPDLPDRDSMAFFWRAPVGVKSLKTVVDALDADTDYAMVTAVDGGSGQNPSLKISNYPVEDVDDGFTFENVARVHEGYESGISPADSPGSALSLGYLTDFTGALKQARMENLSIAWADEYLFRLEASRPEWGIEVTYTMAPRVVREE